MSVIGGALFELVGKLQRSAMKTGRIMQHNSKGQQAIHKACGHLYTQIPSRYSPVQSVSHLERHERGRCQLDSLIIPLSGKVSGLIGMLLFDQPLEGYACVHDDKIAHAHASISASPYLTSLPDKVN